MIALDTNLLVYVYREDSEFHTTAVEQLRPVVEGDSPWALPWPWATKSESNGTARWDASASSGRCWAAM